MAPQKSPAFQFYAKDFQTGTASMSLQEVGAYIRLLAYQWDTGSVPADAKERARVLGCAKAQEVELWKKVGKKFVLKDDTYVNERLEVERSKQTEYRRRQSDKGRASAATRRQPEANQASTEPQPALVPEGQPKGNSPVSGLQSSSTNSSKNDELALHARGGSLIAPGESVKWDRKHGQHLAGFCNWVCFPMDLVDRFAGKIPGDDEGEKRHQIKLWATDIRAKWQGRIVPDGSDYDFWTNRWTETHGGSKPANATLKAVRTAADIDEAFR